MLNFEMPERNRADDVIDALIEHVLAAFPPERLERIRARSEWTWNSKRARADFDDRISYIMLAKESPAAAQRFEAPDDATDIQREMISQLKDMLDFSSVDSEYYPGFPSGLEQVTIPSMFGCVKECVSGSDHVKPVIAAPSDVFSLPPAEIREGSVCFEMLRRMAYKHRRTGGRIPVYMTDIQGPFSCAAQMWGIQDFLCDLDECADAARHLLSLCADAIIKYFYAMRKAAGGTLIPIHCFPMLWVPEDCGVAVSDDFFAVVGARTAEEFSVPYLERIGAEFGGVTAHSCGNMNHLPSVLNSMKHLKALNFGSSETDLEQFASECDPRITIITHQSGLSAAGLPVLDETERLKLCARVQKRTGVKVFAVSFDSGGIPADAASRKMWEDAASLRAN
jgi:Uroporphyrinogen decarboxylase (URO-D).